MNNAMTFSDWVVALLLLGWILFIGGSLVHYHGKAELLESQLYKLKEECVLKGVATYTFDAKGNVTFSILEQKK